MAEVVVTAAAEVDYLDALAWYAERSLRAATGFEAEFDHALKEIAATPQRFARCDKRYRRFLMRRYPFQVVYSEKHAKIVVIAVAHAKRKPRFWSAR